MTDETFYAPLAAFESQAVDWIWPYYLAAGVLTILDGDPGLGKSFLAMHIAAQISVGGFLPDGVKLKRRRVLYLSSEDDPSYTIRPRIEKMGGDPSFIYVQSQYSAFDEKGLQQLREEVIKTRAGPIVIDPLFAFVGADADIFRANQIRQVLADLQGVVDESVAAILAIRHLRKMRSDKAIYQGAGAIDVIGVARCGLIVGEDTEDPEVRILAHSKHNLSKKMPSRTFRLVDQGDDQQPVFEWMGTSDLSADDVIKPRKEDDDAESPRHEAKDFLREYLSKGGRRAAEVYKAAKDVDIAERTLKRAKFELGVKTRQADARWYWRLK